MNEEGVQQPARPPAVAGRAVADLASIIKATMPVGPDDEDWYRAVFAFARHLKGLPEYCGADPADLRPEVRQWHDEASRDYPGRSFEGTLGLFLKDWKQVKFPAGANPLHIVFERAKTARTPLAAQPYEDERLRLLVTFCCEMQRAVGEREFYLDGRSAGRLIGVSGVTAWQWLMLLYQDKPPVLKLVEKGTSRKSNRFFYIGDTPESADGAERAA